MNPWPPKAKIIANGYTVTDEAPTPRTPLEGGDISQRQAGAPGYTVRGFDFMLATDADLNAVQTFFLAGENTLFLWTDPEDGVTYPARLRGGAGAIEYTAEVNGGRRAWRASAEVEGWRPDLREQPAPATAGGVWPLAAAVSAAEFALTDDPAARRVEFDDGAFRQVQPFSLARRRRQINFQLRTDADLFAFRAWARQHAANGFDWTDPADGTSRRARVTGGIGGIRYTAEVESGQRQWFGQCEIEGLTSEAPTPTVKFYVASNNSRFHTGGELVYTNVEVPPSN